MKKRSRLLVVLFAVILVVIMSEGIKIHAGDIEDLNSLIDRGISITDNTSAEAYIWVTDVLNYVEKHQDSSVYSYIRSNCNSAKGSTNISSFNVKNMIIGGLLFLRAELNNETLKTSLELVGEGVSITDNTSPEAYKWIFDVLAVVNNNIDCSVYKSLLSNCNSAKGSTNISSFNVKNMIIADLSVLDNEIATSSIFSGLVIVKSPNKTDYIEGEYFNPTGTEISAVFTNTYKDGTTKSIQKTINDYSVDTNTKLKISDTKWTYSYTYEGVTKTVTQDISVEEFIPELISSTLDSISVATKPKKTEYLIGESFNSKGLKINAKYKNYWSDGSTTYTTSKSVSYTVDETTPLSKNDKKWTISYKDGGVTAKTTIKIKVKSSDPKINYSKKTLTLGDSLQLRIYGTEKYVMWKADNTDVIRLSDTGLVEAVSVGTVKVTATIGSGKKNTKLTCTIKIKPKVSANKSIIFIDGDEYETVTVKANKKNISYNVSSNSSYIKIVDGGNGTYNIVPDVGSVSDSGNAGTTYDNYIAIIKITTSNPNSYSSYVEQEIPVFIYKNKNTLVALSLYSDGFYFDGNRAIYYKESVYKQLKKAAKKSKNVYGSEQIEITKENFEKIIKKAIKAKTVTIRS